jgi:hypothetical protein
MSRWNWLRIVVLAGCLVALQVPLTAPGDEPAKPNSAGSVLSDPNFFPLAVWLQSPNNAAKYKAAGINTYVGLWRGPTD